MWSLLDHLNALVIAAVVALVALAVFVGAGREQTRAVSRSAGVGVLEQTIDWIERDLSNLGGPDAPADSVLVDYAWPEGGGAFTFVTQADTSDGAAPQVVRYERRAVGTAYELRRYEVVAGGERLTARSPATLHRLSVTPLGADGQPVGPGALGAARSVAIRLVMAPPLGRGDPLEWSQRFFLSSAAGF